VIRTSRKQAHLQLEERKLCLFIEGLLLKDAALLSTPGYVVSVRFVNNAFSEPTIVKVMRQYMKAGWNIYRHKISTVDRQAGVGVFMVNYIVLDFS
jgi:hypothetical protein